MTSFRLARPPRPPPRSCGCATPASCSPPCPTSSGSIRGDSLLVHRVRRPLRAADRADPARRPAPGGRRGRRLRRARGEHAACVTRRGRRARGGRRPAGGRGSALRGPATAAELVAVATAALEGRGVPVRLRAWAAGTAAGAAWACYDECGCRGRPARPGHHPARRHRGRRRLVVPAPTARSWSGSSRRSTPGAAPPRTAAHPRRRHRLDLDARRALGRRPDGGPPAPTARRGVAATPCRGTDRARTRGAALADAAAGRLRLDDGRVARARAGPVRPAGARRGAGPLRQAPDAESAEQLWAALARETPDPEAAEPAALLAACALLRGDGAFAGIALDRAEQAWPGHRLTGLLRAAWAAGMPPRTVRECFCPPPPPPARPAALAGRGGDGRGDDGRDALSGGSTGPTGRPASGGQTGWRSCAKRHASPTIVSRSVFSGCQPSAAVAAALEATSTAGSPRAPRDDRRRGWGAR